MPANELAASQTIAARIGLDLPPEARAEYAKQISGQDDAARLIVLMPEAAWQTLLLKLAKKAGEEPAFSSDQNFHLGPPGDGWHPGDATDLKTAQLPWANGREALNLGLASDDPGKVKLFVFWHQL